ncbi:DUF6777 domain-containing protein [Streptomyces sp. NPDC002889]|uniref:DUF6777 domain-containing protein n=1 Tax=Streptomyces sp. NPDC002889 TaxID=3364669 RepID=UPI003674A7DE
MSSQPPSSDRPTGPPSGPLSGPGRQGPPPPPPGGSSGGGPSGPPSGGGPQQGGPGGTGGEPGRPWWRSAPRIAAIAAALVAAVVLAVVFTRPDGGSGGGKELFLQAAGSAGPDPFTESTANESQPTTPAPATAAPGATEAGTNVTRSVRGSAPGLYEGTRKVPSCDVGKQITALGAEPSKNRAFAQVLGIGPNAVPAYLRSLTPVQLRWDTRVTYHGYRDGSPTSYQAVLQAGTAVLVDDRGVPRVRCACGNPLRPPVAQEGTPKPTGDSWPGYRPSNVVIVAPAVQEVKAFVMYDAEDEKWFARPAGDTGRRDKDAPPPKHEPSPCPSKSKSCPPTDKSSSPESPSSPSPEDTPSSEPPSREDTPSSEPPPREQPPSSPPQQDTPPQDTPPSESAPPPSEPSPASGSPAEPPPPEALVY